MNDIKNKAGQLLRELRAKKPLIHNITNYVTVNDCANVILAIGASPVMADDILEAADITSISSALVINIGTLNQRTVEAMLASGKKANELGIPVVLDPVGAGASNFRNETTKRILSEVKLSVLRGNLSEISFIAGVSANTKGVDAAEVDIVSKDGKAIAMAVAKELNCVVAITGAIDVVTDGKRTVTIHNGHKMLSDVTGTGCMTTALIGSFCGAATLCSEDTLTAAVAGITSMGLAGETAFEVAGQKGTGSFHVAVIDAITWLNEASFNERAKVYEK